MLKKKVKILIVGDPNSIFVSNYAYWLRRTNQNFEVDILAVNKTKPENEALYQNIIPLTDSKYFQLIDKYKGIRRLLLIPLYYKLLSQFKDYQFIHFHFVSPLRYSLVSLLKRKTNSKIILSVWGSDLYRIMKIDYRNFKNTCLKADMISFANPESIEYFKTKFNWEKQNLHICRFGLSPLESINKLKLSKAECKEKLGWSSSKLSLTIGYNLSEGQQHLKVIEALQSQKLKSLKEKLILIFPIAYGGSAIYKEKLVKEIEKLDFECLIYEKYMNDSEIAVLRKATDIMIQVQTTDQFSGSMQEHIYAKNVVITGSWLPYKAMKNEGIYFEEIGNIPEIADFLPKVIENYNYYEEKTYQNTEIIYKLSSWENNIDTWSKLYK